MGWTIESRGYFLFNYLIERVLKSFSRFQRREKVVKLLVFIFDIIVITRRIRNKRKEEKNAIVVQVALRSDEQQRSYAHSHTYLYIHSFQVLGQTCIAVNFFLFSSSLSSSFALIIPFVEWGIFSITESLVLVKLDQKERKTRQFHVNIEWRNSFTVLSFFPHVICIRHLCLNLVVKQIDDWKRKLSQ